MKHLTATEIQLRWAHAAKKVDAHRAAVREEFDALHYQVLMRLFWRLHLIAQSSQLRLTYQPAVKVTVLPYMGKPEDPKGKEYLPRTAHTNGVIRKRAIIVESEE